MISPALNVDIPRGIPGPSLLWNIWKILTDLMEGSMEYILDLFLGEALDELLNGFL